MLSLRKRMRASFPDLEPTPLFAFNKEKEEWKSERPFHPRAYMENAFLRNLPDETLRGMLRCPAMTYCVRVKHRGYSVMVGYTPNEAKWDVFWNAEEAWRRLEGGKS